MRKAAELLLGEHDFKAFTSAKKSKKSTVRRIDEIRIERIENRVEFVFTGNGFLHHMIRILMGTLLEVGKGIRTPESVTDILKSGDRAKRSAGTCQRTGTGRSFLHLKNKNTATFCPTIASSIL